MNLSKDDLLKIALNSKPKKEVLEKKSKAELIEYLFGIQVNECAQKKINACRSKLEKCDDTFETGSFPGSYTSLYSPVMKQPRVLVRERIDESNEFIPPKINILAVEDRIKQLDEIVNSWNSVEKPQILKLLEDSKVAIREWINQQKPFLERKVTLLEEGFNKWQAIEKPLMENQIRELREARSVVQDFDQNLAKEAIRKINEFQTVIIPNSQQQISELSIQLDLIQPVLSQLRNEHLKIIQITEPIANFETFIARLVNDTNFRNSFLNFRNEIIADFNQRLVDLENSMQFRLETAIENEPRLALMEKSAQELGTLGQLEIQVGQMEMQLDQIELQVSQYQSTNNTVAEQLDSMRESIRQYLLTNLREFFEQYISEQLRTRLTQQLSIENERNQLEFRNKLSIMDEKHSREIVQFQNDSELILTRFNELQSNVSQNLSQLQLDFNSRLAIEDGTRNAVEQIQNDTQSLYRQFQGLKGDITSNLSQLQLEFSSQNEVFQKQLQIVANELKAPELQIAQLRNDNALMLQQFNELKNQTAISGRPQQLAIEANSTENRLSDLEKIVKQNDDKLKKKLKSVTENQEIINNRLIDIELKLENLNRLQNLINVVYTRGRRAEEEGSVESRPKRLRLPAVPALPPSE